MKVMGWGVIKKPTASSSLKLWGFEAAQGAVTGDRAKGFSDLLALGHGLARRNLNSCNWLLYPESTNYGKGPKRKTHQNRPLSSFPEARKAHEHIQCQPRLSFNAPRTNRGRSMSA